MTTRVAIGTIARWPRWALVSLASIALMLIAAACGIVWARASSIPVIETKVTALEKRAEEDRANTQKSLDRIEQKVDQILERGR